VHPTTHPAVWVEEKGHEAMPHERRYTWPVKDLLTCH
jgi:hypothetical protein